MLPRLTDAACDLEKTKKKIRRVKSRRHHGGAVTTRCDKSTKQLSTGREPRLIVAASGAFTSARASPISPRVMS